MNQPEDWETNSDAEAFEADLTRALQPVDPPQGFADRVLARAASAKRPAARVLLMPVGARWAAGAIAAVLLAGVFTSAEIHVRRERARTETAEREFQAAIAITSATLDDVREQLNQIDMPAAR